MRITDNILSCVGLKLLLHGRKCSIQAPPASMHACLLVARPATANNLGMPKVSQQQWPVLLPVPAAGFVLLNLAHLLLLPVLGCRAVLQSAKARSWRPLKALRSTHQALCSM
jgi:hypothetical protein